MLRKLKILFTFATQLHLHTVAVHSDLRTFTNILFILLAIYLAVQPAFFHALHVHQDHACQEAMQDSSAGDISTISKEVQQCSLCELYHHTTLAWEHNVPVKGEVFFQKIAHQLTIRNYKITTYSSLRGPPFTS